MSAGLVISAILSSAPVVRVELTLLLAPLVPTATAAFSGSQRVFAQPVEAAVRDGVLLPALRDLLVALAEKGIPSRLLLRKLRPVSFAGGANRHLFREARNVEAARIRSLSKQVDLGMLSSSCS
jgi:hypothetical protein